MIKIRKIKKRIKIKKKMRKMMVYFQEKNMKKMKKI